MTSDAPLSVCLCSFRSQLYPTRSRLMETSRAQ